MAVRVDQNTLQVIPTDNPLIFIVSAELTDDGDEIPDYEKKFTRIQFRYNRNMTKSDIVTVAMVEYNKIKNAPTASDIRDGIVTTFGTTIKPFDRTPPAPPAPEPGPPEVP